MDEDGNTPHTTISERCRDTRQQFVGLLSEIEDHQPQKAVLSDSLERFMLWAGNLGAMRQPSSKLSLDQRLVKAPEVHGLICQHVDDIREAVGDLSGVLLQDGAPENDDQETLGPDPDAEEPFDEAGMLLEVVAEAISSLFRLGILVRKSSPTDRFRRALQMSDISFDDTLDIGHVRDKHPKMRDPQREWLTTRLGRLISKRRLFIKYSRDHKARLEYQEPLRGEISEEHATQTQRQSSKATTFHLDRLPVSVLAPSPADPEDVPQLEEEDIDEVVSVMSASTISNTLSVLKLPALADLSANGQAFECPICFTLQHFQREKAWKVHAFRDLKAYVCTAGESDRCNEEYFGDRNTWFEHELYYHRAQYICAVCQDQQPVPYSAFSQHMAANHPQISGNHLKAIEEVSRQIPTHFDANDCPFCDDWAEQIRQKADPKGKRPDLPTPFSGSSCMVSTIRFKRHVALHQEQLAIFALPRMREDGDQTDHGGTDKSVVSSESVSTHQSQVSRDSWELLPLNYTYQIAKEILKAFEKIDSSGIIVRKPGYSTEHAKFLVDMAVMKRNVELTAKLLILVVDSIQTNLEDPEIHREEFVKSLEMLEECRQTEIERLAVEAERLKPSPELGSGSHANLCRKLAAEVENTIDLVNAWIVDENFEKIIPGWRANDENARRMKLRKVWDGLADIITQHYTEPSDTTANEAPLFERLAVRLINTPESRTELNTPELNTPEDPPPTNKASTARTADLITIRSPAIHKTLELDPGCSWQEADAIIKAGHGNNDKDNDDQPESDGKALIQQGRYTLMLVGPNGSYFKAIDQANWKELVKPGSFLRLLPMYRGLRTKEERDKNKRSVADEAEREKIEDEGSEHFGGAAITDAEEEEAGAPVRVVGDKQEGLGGEKSRGRLLIDDRRQRQRGIALGNMEELNASILLDRPEPAATRVILREKFEEIIESSVAKHLIKSGADVIDVLRKRFSAEAKAEEPRQGEKNDT